MSAQAQKVLDAIIKILTALSTAGILALFVAYGDIRDRFNDEEVSLAKQEVRLDALVQQVSELRVDQKVQGAQLHNILVELAKLSQGPQEGGK
jgi:uncharacterized coiled-coil protein SlyX